MFSLLWVNSWWVLCLHKISMNCGFYNYHSDSWSNWAPSHSPHCHSPGDVGLCRRSCHGWFEHQKWGVNIVSQSRLNDLTNFSGNHTKITTKFVQRIMAWKRCESVSKSDRTDWNVTIEYWKPEQKQFCFFWHVTESQSILATVYPHSNTAMFDDPGQPIYCCLDLPFSPQNLLIFHGYFFCFFMDKLPMGR